MRKKQSSLPERDDTISIYTFNTSLKRRLAEYAEKYPDLAKLERQSAEGSVIYVLEKSSVSIRLLPPCSEERRKVSSGCGKKYGINGNKKSKKRIVD